MNCVAVFIFWSIEDISPFCDQSINQAISRSFNQSINQSFEHMLIACHVHYNSLQFVAPSLLSSNLFLCLCLFFLLVSFSADAKAPTFYKLHTPLLGAAAPPSNTPSAPRDLTANLISSRFVTLTWLAPLVTNGGVVLTYSVYYKQVGSTRERVFNTSSSQREANIQGLRPDSNFAFRVVAYNEFGPGDSTKELSVRTHPEGIHNF